MSGKAFYDTASQILDKLLSQQGTIKSLIHQQQKVDKKLLYAVICQTLKYREIIELILSKSPIKIATERKTSSSLSMLLIHDLLFGKLQNCAYKVQILKHKTRLNAELVKIKIKRNARSNEDLLPKHVVDAIILPRYIRVNTLKITVEDAVSHFIKEDYKLCEAKIPGVPKPKTFWVDSHVPNLLVLPANSDLHKDKLFIDGSIILQDKASCFPAFILNPNLNSICIDACAAPGNKTSHLSAIMENTGKIIAFDKDKRRMETLIRLTGKAGCSNIQTILGSFLEADPNSAKFSNVEFILLDPSCSGSGIVGRMDHLLKDVHENEDFDEVADRLTALSDFQKSAILHAMKFPSVKKIVYSTCSKYIQENEDVVNWVLDHSTGFQQSSDTFSTWKRRGLGENGQAMIRTLPEEDMTIGFFTCLFERVK